MNVWMVAGGLVVGALAGLAVGESARSHLRRVNATLVDDLRRERALRQQWVRVAEDRIREQVSKAKPDARDWVPRAEMVRLAHRCEQAEAEVAQLRHPSGGAAS